MTYKPGLDRVEAWPVELRNSTGWSSRWSSWSSRWLPPSSFAYPVELRPCAKSFHAPHVPYAPECSKRPISKDQSEAVFEAQSAQFKPKAGADLARLGLAAFSYLVHYKYFFLALCMTRRSNKDNLVEHPEIDKLEKQLRKQKPKRWPTKQLALTPLKWRALKKKEEIHLLLLLTLLEM
ncbi:unnamed protein product [Microthlaspi erraticum]|uniref:Uncharacterized protein n=1 Tax=Microthlaspi erraticum TaxID=1685480 RepID=A0A6D2JJC0_9BRAS|nr:unnamed protein product [Microthlaspi erraticum]